MKTAVRNLTLCMLAALVAASPLFSAACESDSIGAYRADHNLDFGDYGVLFYEASDASCAQNAANALLRKLQNTPTDAWTRWLGGINVEMALATAFVLEGRGLLSNNLEDKLDLFSAIYTEDTVDWQRGGALTACDDLDGSGNHLADDIPPPAGVEWVADDNLLNADTCMDDYAIAAAAFAWIYAYEDLQGRNATGHRNWAIEYLDRSFSTVKSICVQPPDSGVCAPQGGYLLDCEPVNDAHDLDTMLQNGYRVLPLNHNQESPAYGFGLLTSVSNAIYALRIAGSDWPRNDTNKRQLQDRLAQELFFHSQDKVEQLTGGSFRFDDTCDKYAGSRCTNANGSCAERCEPQDISAGRCTSNDSSYDYRPAMYPLFDLLDREFALTSHLEYSPLPFKFDTFDDALFSSNYLDFHHWGRRAVYGDLAWRYPYPEPKVSINYPEPSGTVISGEVAFWGWATDGEGTPSLHFKADGQPTALREISQDVLRNDVCARFPRDPDCPHVGWNGYFDPSGLHDGPHTFSISSADSYGNESDPFVRSFQVKKRRLGGAVTTLLPTDDTFLDQGNPNANYGSSPYLEVRDAASGVARIGMIKFDLASISAIGARLRLRNAGLSTIRHLAVWYGNNDNWSESTATWSNTPLDARMISSVRDVLPGETVYIDVSAILDGSRYVTLGLTTPDDVGGLRLYSSEHYFGSNRPALLLDRSLIIITR